MIPTPKEFAENLYKSTLEHHNGETKDAYKGCLDSVSMILNALRPDDSADSAFKFFEEVKQEFETNYNLEGKK